MMKYPLYSQLDDQIDNDHETISDLSDLYEDEQERLNLLDIAFNGTSETGKKITLEIHAGAIEQANESLKRTGEGIYAPNSLDGQKILNQISNTMNANVREFQTYCAVEVDLTVKRLERMDTVFKFAIKDDGSFVLEQKEEAPDPSNGGNTSINTMSDDMKTKNAPANPLEVE